MENGVDRRQFTRLMAASLGLAGATMSGCRRWPEQFVVPQSARTEGVLPGVAIFFATQFEMGGIATGILAKSVDGRPIKIEGNELHPFSQGAAGVFAQASVLELYDPDRTRGYLFRSHESTGGVQSRDNGNITTAATATMQTRKTFEKQMKPIFAASKKAQGRGLAVLAQSSSSPTMARLRKQFESEFPLARWSVFEPLDRDNEIAGSKLAFGDIVRPQYQLEKAKTIVCLDADLLGMHPGSQKWCRDWASGRNPDSENYSRLWMVESGYSLTGAAADVRVALRPSEMFGFVQAIAKGIGMQGNALADLRTENLTSSTSVQGLVNELQQSGPHSLLVAGPSQSAEIHAQVHAINRHLGTVGTTVTYTAEPLAEKKIGIVALEDLNAALRGGAIETLVILGGNPVYDSPVDIRLELPQNKNLTSIFLGLFENETAQQCTWHAPLNHYLEAWGDGRGWDGSYGIQQPLIQGLFDGISEVEMVSLMLGQSVDNGMELVRSTARDEFGVANEKDWQQLLHDGVLAGSAYDVMPVNVVADASSKIGQDTVSVALANSGFTASATGREYFEICFHADPSTYDGRFANNGWLQELPDPLTKLTWDNAALISNTDADQHHLSDGDVIVIEMDGDHRIDEIPVLIQPGQAVGTISIRLGYGRRTGYVASNVGTDVGPIRTSQRRFSLSSATISRTGRRHRLAITQEPFLTDAVGMAAREARVGKPTEPGMLIRETTLEKHLHDPSAVHHEFHTPPAAPMFNPPDSFNSPSAWGMSIDLNRCVGCNACVIGCQAENNVPIVGKVNVLQNREMHWLRIDRYFKGPAESPDVVHVPMACAHCENAPCEQVCPVAATVHDTEGLNAMVYNRCVGTRYCANNCPYKVRRFNYFDFHASDPKLPAQPWLNIPDRETKEEVSELRQLGFNPEVSVRMRGVMEKCTYCVQRISSARIAARNEYAKGKRESADLMDGEVQTACQQACPTQAIQFGDLNNAKSAVSLAHADPRAYAMLEELNIKPRTKFLARVRNVDGNAMKDL